GWRAHAAGPRGDRHPPGTAGAPEAAPPGLAECPARGLGAGGAGMKLARSFRVGSLRCHALEGGIQRLDGGAMFGVVPRPLWERQIAPDERHRISLSMRCLLVE